MMIFATHTADEGNISGVFCVKQKKSRNQRTAWIAGECEIFAERLLQTATKTSIENAPAKAYFAWLLFPK